MAFKTSGVKQLAIYGACGGLLLASIQFIEYRFLFVERSTQIYGLLVATAFAIVGLALGLTMTGRKDPVKDEPVPAVRTVPDVPTGRPFAADANRIAEVGLTPRELEVLHLIAEGLSNREMAERLFVSENTVKTHTSRVFDKLGASRRTQAVQIAKQQRIIA